MLLPPAVLFPGERNPPPQEPVVTALLEESMVRSLNRLDEVLSPNVKPARNVSIRLALGVTNHFRTRCMEWFTAILMFQFGWILYSSTPVFQNQPSFRYMENWMSEETWGLTCMALGLIHLIALSVNGTFTGFKYSPHIRAVSSFIACYMWFQIMLAIFLSGLGGTGLGTYRLVLLFEFGNFIFACMDVGRTEARRKVNGE